MSAGGLAGILNLMKDSCSALSKVTGEGQVDGETTLEVRAADTKHKLVIPMVEA